MTWQRRRFLATGLLVASLVAGAAVSILRSADGDALPEPPVFPGAIQVGVATFNTAGLNVRHESSPALAYRTPAVIDEVADFYASNPGGWRVEARRAFGGNEYVLYLTRGERIAIVRVLHGGADLKSLLEDDSAAPGNEADGAVFTIGLIDCQDPGGVAACLGEVAGT